MLEKMERLQDGLVRLTINISRLELENALAHERAGGTEEEEAVRRAVNISMSEALEDALLQSGIEATAMRRPGAVSAANDGGVIFTMDVIPLPQVDLAGYREIHVKSMRIDARGRTLTDEEQERADTALREAVTEQVVQQARVTLPKALVDAKLEAMMRSFESEKARQVLDPSVRNLQGDELREKLRPKAENLLKRELVLDAVAETEGLRVTQRDTDAAIMNLGRQYHMTPAEVKQRMNKSSTEQLRAELRRNRAVDLLTARAVKE